MKTAVLLLTFNRLDYLRDVFSAVAEAKPPRLYIASDGARPEKEGEKEKVQEVRDYLLNHIDWDCEVKTRFLDKNSGGCKYGVSGAITWFFENESEGIILEDDCLPSPSFFAFCEKMLSKYRNDKKVYSIVGYLPTDKVESSYAYEFASVSHCWGWATWSDRWKNFRLDISDMNDSVVRNISLDADVQEYWKYTLHRVQQGGVNSWYYPWNFCIAENHGLTIFPTKNLISNIGTEGEHYTGEDKRLHTATYNLFVKKYHRKQMVDLMNGVLWKYFYNLQNPFRNKKKTQSISKSVCRKYKLFGFIPLLSIEEK